MFIFEQGDISRIALALDLNIDDYLVDGRTPVNEETISGDLKELFSMLKLLEVKYKIQLDEQVSISPTQENMDYITSLYAKSRTILQNSELADGVALKNIASIH